MIYALPSKPKIQFDRSDIEDHIEWIWGKGIAGSHPTPSFQIIRDSDVALRENASTRMYAGISLEEALKELRADDLFWTREVHDRAKGISTQQQESSWEGKGYRPETSPRASPARLTPVPSEIAFRPTPGPKAGGFSSKEQVLMFLGMEVHR